MFKKVLKRFNAKARKKSWQNKFKTRSTFSMKGTVFFGDMCFGIAIVDFLFVLWRKSFSSLLTSNFLRDFPPNCFENVQHWFTKGFTENDLNLDGQIEALSLDTICFALDDYDSRVDALELKICLLRQPEPGQKISQMFCEEPVIEFRIESNVYLVVLVQVCWVTSYSNVDSLNATRKWLIIAGIEATWGVSTFLKSTSRFSISKQIKNGSSNGRKVKKTSKSVDSEGRCSPWMITTSATKRDSESKDHHHHEIPTFHPFVPRRHALLASIKC